MALHVLDGRLWVVHQDRMIERAELHPDANATAPRGAGNDSPLPDADDQPPATAAGIAYANETRPLVDPDGGYSDPHDDQQDEDRQDQEQQA